MAYDRITDHDLQIRVDWLNKSLNRPLTRGHYDEFKKWIDHIGNIFIDRYSINEYQFKLAEMLESGGVHEWTNHRMTRREFYSYLNGMGDVLDVLDRILRESKLNPALESV